MTKTVRAVGYIRVSTAAQASDDKMSLDNQEEQIERYCTYRKFELLKPVFRDDGLSGLKALLDAARRKEFQHVIVNDLSRFGRSAKNLLDNIELLHSFGITFHTCKGGGLDSRSDYGKFLITVLGACAELEAEQIKVRLTEVRLAKLRAGKIVWGNLPYGYRWNEEEERAEEFPEEARIYKRMLNEYLELGNSLATIALGLQKDKIPSRAGKQWFASTIRNIFKNPAHCGSMMIKIREKRKDEYGEEEKVVVEEVPIELPQLVKHHRWNELQGRLVNARHKRSGRPVVGADRFLLRGLLTCGICGKKVVPRAVGKNKDQFIYACYWHLQGEKVRRQYGKEKCPLPPIPANKLDELIYSYILFKLADFDDDNGPSEHYEALVSDKRLDEHIEKLDQRLEDLKSQLSTQERGLAFWQGQALKPNFNPTGWNETRNKFLDEIAGFKSLIAEVRKEIKKAAETREDREKFAEFAKSDQIHEIHDKLTELSNEERHRLLAGLIDGSVVITPPAPNAKIDPKSSFQLKDWVKFQFRPNIPILIETLGVDNSSRYPNG